MDPIQIFEFFASPFGFFTLFAVLFVAAMVGRTRTLKKRRAAFQQLAMQLGMSYEEKAVPFADPAGDLTGQQPAVQLSILPTTKHFFAREHRNVLRGSRGGMEMVVFDMRTKQGKNSRESTHVAMRVGTNLVPDFHLSPEIKIFGFDLGDLAFGMKDIDFDHYPNFSERWWLFAQDEPGIRKLFERGIIATLEALPPEKRYSVQSAGGWLFFTHWMPYWIKPDLIPEFVEDAARIAGAFRQAARASAGI